MTSFDRRRVTVAAIFTVLVLLVNAWLSGDDDTTDATTDTLVGLASAPSTTAYDPEAPVFVAGDGGSDQMVPAQVLVPPPPTGNVVVGRASHARFAEFLDQPCSAGVAPDQVELTITNLNNGQSTTCTNTYGKFPPAGIDIVIDADQFAQIANLTDAPIPVRITW